LPVDCPSVGRKTFGLNRTYRGRYVAKAVLMGVYRKSATKADLPKVRGNIASGKGIGEPLITEFLADVPGVNESTVKQHIAGR
jgi:hypothetical protein